MLDSGNVPGAGCDELAKKVAWLRSQTGLGSACLGVTSGMGPLAASSQSWLAPGTEAGLWQGLQRRVAGDCCDPP